jgi:hypothetical protein
VTPKERVTKNAQSKARYSTELAHFAGFAGFDGSLGNRGVVSTALTAESRSVADEPAAMAELRKGIEMEKENTSR